MNNISLDKDILDYWRANARAEFVRKAVSDKFKQFINELNPLLRRINDKFHYDVRNLTNGGYITNNDGSVQVYILLPSYPNDTTTMGPFFIRVTDDRHDRKECRYCVNLEKVESSQQLAEIISSCLLNPQDITPKFIRHGILISEAEAKRKLIALY